MNKNIKKMIRRKKVIGSGARRLVYDLGNGYVLKVSKSKNGIRSNKNEVVIYKSAASRLKKHLAYIKKYDKGFNWLIMKKYIRDFPKTKEYKRKLFKVRAKFRKHGIMTYDLVNLQGIPNYQNLSSTYATKYDRLIV
ncbi:hypothetical protein O9H85_00075 [Paenibacillus filicis]|uniref:Uncharacterized protein n=1 Tax=Paenibacillus gyeongsangnamensis TaxID=3388067 RepID=A0ABT4Q264_9BACL|nr:hypothetical protein [Paenibacillus filicis]MCZ8510862.1 hypothetical protein [Paenibacillus filicis]